MNPNQAGCVLLPGRGGAQHPDLARAPVGQASTCVTAGRAARGSECTGTYFLKEDPKQSNREQRSGL